MADAMPHLQALGMRRNPFPLAPDAAGFFMTPRMREHVGEILHCIEARKGFLLITGDVGMGKTTLSRYLMSKLESRDVRTAMVLNTFLQGEALIAAINRDFGIDDAPGLDQRLRLLNAFLLEQYREGRNCVIMIDDGQNLNPESLELLRQISNLETGQEKLVQIVLIAQPEILASLAQIGIRQLASRLALIVRLSPMRPSELGHYVRFCLVTAGCERRLPLSFRARRALARRSRGVPRRVNLIMDRCLYAAAARRLSRVGARLVHRAADELELFGKRAGRLRPRMAVAAGVAVGVAGSLVFLAMRDGGMAGAGGIEAKPAHRSVAAPEDGEGPSIGSSGTGMSPEDAGVLNVFRLGAHSDGVAALQRRLAALGYYHYAVDGIVGMRTVAALAAFQARHGVPATGRPDGRTLMMLAREEGGGSSLPGRGMP